mmetsp:Transcript_30591/g.89387  ORF Transcript_30591/g.89387 Transcript_30591/m.89387 type:complete len:212 (+) Transcript_30591:1360-1995(+)
MQEASTSRGRTVLAVGNDLGQVPQVRKGLGLSKGCMAGRKVFAVRRDCEASNGALSLGLGVEEGLLLISCAYGADNDTGAQWICNMCATWQVLQSRGYLARESECSSQVERLCLVHLLDGFDSAKGPTRGSWSNRLFSILASKSHVTGTMHLPQITSPAPCTSRQSRHRTPTVPDPVRSYELYSCQQRRCHLLVILKPGQVCSFPWHWAMR